MADGPDAKALAAGPRTAESDDANAHGESLPGVAIAAFEALSSTRSPSACAKKSKIGRSYAAGAAWSKSTQASADGNF
jgi:hypothetical protein